MRIRGKKLSVTQMKIAMANGVYNPDDYLYQGMKVLSDAGKHLNQHSTKEERMILVHRISGEIVECKMEV